MPSQKTNSISSPTEKARLVTFQTDLGWIGFSHDFEILTRVKFGLATESELLPFFEKPYRKSSDLTQFESNLVNQLSDFSVGNTVEFEQIEIDESWMTPFQKAVTNACRGIRFGQTVSYGQLAKSAGSSKAARAVGRVMSQNPYPLIVPCHRVLGGNGKLVGFSAPKGKDMKLRLLHLEGSALFSSL